MQAYTLIFEKSHQIRVAILAENGDAAERRVNELLEEFANDDLQTGECVTFLWLEKTEPDQSFVLDGKEYLTDSETLKALHALFPTDMPRTSAGLEMGLLIQGQSMSRIIAA